MSQDMLAAWFMRQIYKGKNKFEQRFFVYALCQPLSKFRRNVGIGSWRPHCRPFHRSREIKPQTGPAKRGNQWRAIVQKDNIKSNLPDLIGDRFVHRFAQPRLGRRARAHDGKQQRIRAISVDGFSQQRMVSQTRRGGKPLVQIAYLRDDGTPVALCIIPAGPDEKPVNMGQAQGMDLARWNTPGYGYLLIGGSDPVPLAAEADTFRRWSTGETI